MTSSLSKRQLLSLGLAAVALSACKPLGQSQRIRIGYQKNGVLLLAWARGELDKALAQQVRIEIDWLQFASGPPLLEAMRAGAIDIGAVGDTPPIFAQSAGSPVVYAAAVPNADAAESVIVPAASKIRSLADLKGAKVGLTKGSSSHLLLIEALKSAGLSISDVTTNYLAPPDAASAFANGAIDAWAIWDPYLALAQQRGATRTLISRHNLSPSSSFILANRDFAAQKPKQLSAVLDFLVNESAWGNSHVPEAARIVASQTGIPQNIAELALRRAPLAIQPVTPEIAARQQVGADLVFEQGFIPAKVRVADAVWSGWTPG